MSIEGLGGVNPVQLLKQLGNVGGAAPQEGDAGGAVAQQATAGLPGDSLGGTPRGNASEIGLEDMQLALFKKKPTIQPGTKTATIGIRG